MESRAYAIIHHFHKFGGEFVQTDEALDLLNTFTRFVCDFLYGKRLCKILANLARIYF